MAEQTNAAAVDRKVASARKRRITKQIASRRLVLKKWSIYVQDETLKRAIQQMEAVILELQTEYVQLGGSTEELRARIAELLSSG